MKKSTLFLIISILLAEISYAQWESVCEVSPNIIITSPMVAYYYWNEGGGTPSNPWGIGHVMRTTDGLNSWTEIYSIGSEYTQEAGSIWSLDFINDTVGCIGIFQMPFTSAFYHTHDGGENWKSIVPGPPDEICISFPRADYGYFTGYSTNGYGLYRYDDGIKTKLDSIWLRSLYFINDSVGFRKPLQSNTPYYRTDDYGVTWQVACDSSLTVKKIMFPGKQYGFYVTTSSELFYSNDQGLTWSFVTNVPITPLRDLFFLDSIHGWACGNNGQILKTITGGLTWEQVPAASTDNVSSIIFFSEEVGYYTSVVKHFWDSTYVLYRTATGPWGIESTEPAKPVRILHNPIRSVLVLKNDVPDADIEMMDIITMTGKPVFHSTVFTQQIDISSMASGLYMLRYRYQDRYFTEKFIISKE